MRRLARRPCPKSDVPPPVQAESTNGNQSLSDSITPQSSPDGLGVGNEAATATTQPSSGSLTTVSNISVPGRSARASTG